MYELNHFTFDRYTYYRRTGFDGEGLTVATIATKNYRYVGIRYRNYAHYNACRSCVLIYGITIIRLLSFFIS